jgi:hypothetical protein
MKSVELEKMSNFYFFRFSTSLEILKIILKFGAMAVL